jgi:hypothetical protein
MPLEGFEPPTAVPKTAMISISPQGLNIYLFYHKNVNMLKNELSNSRNNQKDNRNFNQQRI